MGKPKISIITPTYNQALFIERTIQSVINQDYPNMEYIVLDAKSTDGTLDILKKYKEKLIWKSEKDSGQSDAINKGLRQASGDIVAFLNSDDIYEPGSLAKVAEFFEQNPKKKWAYGKCKIIDENDKETGKFITAYKNLLLKNYSYPKLLSENFVSQPATFWRKELHDEFGYFDEDNHWCMDYEFWLRIGQKYPAGVINQYLARFRRHTDSKSVMHSKEQFKEEYIVAKKYANGQRLPLILHRFNFYKITWSYKIMAYFKQSNK